MHALDRTVGVAMRYLDATLGQNAFQKPVDGGLVIERALRWPPAVKYVIRAFLDADGIRPFRQDFARSLRKRGEELCLGGFEIAL